MLSRTDGEPVGYYQHQQRATRAIDGTSLLHVKAAFASSGRTYDNRRIRHALAAQGIKIGRYKIRSLMRQAQLRPVWKHKFIHTTDSKHHMPGANNILNRKFDVEEADMAWTLDITYIRTK